MVSPGPSHLPDRTVTVTFPPGTPEDLVRMRVHVDGIHHGDAREATEGGWEYVPTTGGPSIGYATFWELLTALRQLPPGRARPGLRVNLENGERRAALVAYGERGLTAGWLPAVDIPADSPIAIALLGRRAGDQVHVELGAGVEPLVLTVLRVV